MKRPARPKSTLSRVEKRAWQILKEWVKSGKNCDFIIAYCAAVSEANRRRRARQLNRN